ncbi:MAG: cobalamin B12-binding domain-containing protein [Rubellimicrobium sp.]|nr:cobalamin B12-binding domain-containing protein [Rubellimicrobium sp.]
MSTHDPLFDAKLFERTASLFAVKREAFPPDAVEALASDIVRRLATTIPTGPHNDGIDISEAEVKAFCDVLIVPDPSAALQFMKQRRSEGVTRRGIYLGYICAAARELGEGWEQDRFSFMDVTTGTGHLYALMRALRAEGPSLRPRPGTDRSALFATVPGEDHGIGITVAADLFRDIGWDIDLRTGTDHDGLLQLVERTQPRIIGLSLSTEARLDALVRLVVAIRMTMPHVIIGVAPGANLDAERVRALVDIDLVFEDARSALVELDRLIRLRD